MNADRPQILIAGGGIAGIEALLALRDLAGERPAITLVSPEPELVYRPLLVDEPFTLEPAARYALAEIAAEFDAEFVLDRLESVDPEAGRARLTGTEQTFDMAIVCTGGRPRSPFGAGITFSDRDGPHELRRLLDGLDRAGSGVERIAFVVPSGVSWSLPIYELALLTREAIDARRDAAAEIVVVTPEAAPLIAFGSAAAEALSEMLNSRGITVLAGHHLRELDDGRLVLTPGDETLRCDHLVALPLLDGPAVPGLPHDDHGFMPIDSHARIVGCSDVYAAGDGAGFPIKQGTVGTQMADAAAAHIAWRLGQVTEAPPFRPLLRGKLFAGRQSLYLKQRPTGGDGEGEISPDPLWWPPEKVSGHYLSRWLSHEDPGASAPPPGGRPLEVEVAWPAEWHEDPLALDPYAAPADDG